MDSCGIDRAVLINYVAPEVIGFTSGVNQFVADYVKENPGRLLSCGSLHPRHTTNVLADVEQILRLGIRMIKIHPPHQGMPANAYTNGLDALVGQGLALLACEVDHHVGGLAVRALRPKEAARAIAKGTKGVAGRAAN